MIINDSTQISLWALTIVLEINTSAHVHRNTLGTGSTRIVLMAVEILEGSNEARIISFGRKLVIDSLGRSSGGNIHDESPPETLGQTLELELLHPV